VKILAVLARYAAGAATCWMIFPIEAGILYAVGLAVAIVTGLDPGGPLAGPAMIIVGAAGGTALTLGVALPTVAVLDVTQRRLGWIRAHFLSAMVAVGLLAVAAWFGGAALNIDPLGRAAAWAVLAALSAAPIAAFFVVERGVRIATRVMSAILR
jgi:hypothetical protein